MAKVKRSKVKRPKSKKVDDQNAKSNVWPKIIRPNLTFGRIGAKKSWPFSHTALTLAHYFGLFRHKLYYFLSLIRFLDKLCHFDYMICKIFCFK